MSEEIIVAAGLLLALRFAANYLSPPLTAKPNLYFHIKHGPYPDTLGKVQKIYGDIEAANQSGLPIGLEPQITADWQTTLAYLHECGDIPIMLNVFTSDDSLQLTINQISEAVSNCNVQWLRFHETLSFYQPFPIAYAQSILNFAKTANIPVFWNEWDINTYPQIAQIITTLSNVLLNSLKS